MKHLIENFTPCKEPTVPGIMEIYMKSRSELGFYWFYEETHIKQFGKVTGVSSTNGFWYKIKANRGSVNFKQNQSNDISRLYNISFDLTWSQCSYVKRDIIEQLRVQNDTVVICKDFSGKWWLLGETFGMKTPVWNFNSGDQASLNETGISMLTSERFPIREVSADFVTNLPFMTIMLCDLTLDDLCGDTLSNLCSNNAVLN